jgi:hypothetical protein
MNINAFSTDLEFNSPAQDIVKLPVLAEDWEAFARFTEGLPASCCCVVIQWKWAATRDFLGKCAVL